MTPYVTYDRNLGRGWVQNGKGKSILWTSQMLSMLRNYFPTTRNEELAGMLGVSRRTMIRKARVLGLEKDGRWLKGIWEEHRKMANMMSRTKGYPGGFQKGRRANPKDEFKKGHKLTEEQLKKKSESMRFWYMNNRSAAREKALKAWQTRRNNLINNNL